MADSTHSSILCVPFDAIRVEERIRSQMGEMQEFATQLRDEGQLNPITFEWEGEGDARVMRLNTGGRRWGAAALLFTKDEFIGMKLPEGSPRRAAPGCVLARWVGDLDDIERLVLELTENNSRKDFTNAEKALGFAKLRKLMEEKEGKTIRVSDLAQRLSLSVGQVGMGLKVAQAINADPTSDLSKKLINAPSVKSAFDKLQTHNKLGEIKRRVATRKDTEAEWEKAIAHSDGFVWLKTMQSESIDFFNFDPPWGVGIDDYDRNHKHENFDDSPEYAWDDVIKPMVPQLYRVLKADAWGTVWFGQQYYSQLKELLEKSGFRVNPIPSIWFKTNKGGSQNNPDIVEMNVYESFFVVRKGDPRLFKKPCLNVLPHPMDFGAEREHYAQKSEAVMYDILERYTFGNMHVIDPTYGVGRIFTAAKKLGRQFSGAEKNANNREKASAYIKQGG